jgi:hypothetical protein
MIIITVPYVGTYLGRHREVHCSRVDLKYCILSIAQVLCNGQRFGICCAVGGIFPSPVQNHIFSEEQLHNAWASAGGKSNCDGEFFACCLGACTACITP